MTLRKLVTSLLLLAVAGAALAGCAALVGTRAAEREAEAEARYPPVGRFVDVGGQSVHVHVEGTGPDLVLLHGASGNLRDFTFALAGALAGDYRVIAFDRPGMGWSDPLPGDALGPREQADHLRAAADALGVRRPVVVGHSFGGAVALGWGLGDPEGTAALVILAGASHPWEGSLSLTQTLPGTALGRAVVNPLVTAFAGREAVARVLGSVFRPQAVPAGYDAHVGTGLMLRRGALARNAAQLSALKPHLAAMAPLYPGLPMPVEIVHGTADRTVGLAIHGERLARDVPGAELTRLEGTGHMPHHTDTDAVIAAIHRAAARAGLR